MTSKVVLVADDNLTVQRVAGEMLAQEGLEVITVANGMAAIKKLADAKPLVVLADADMPGKDGYEVCDFVKRQPDLTYVRVLLAVSDGDPFDPVRGAQAGVDGVVKKPFDREDLVSAVVKSLGEAQAMCPPPPQEEPFDPWQSPRDLAGESAPHPGIVGSAFVGDFEFSSSAPAADAQDFPAEFLEPSVPPVVEWQAASSGFPGDLRLEAPTPASDFPGADAPAILPEGASELEEIPRNPGRTSTLAREASYCLPEGGDTARIQKPTFRDADLPEYTGKAASHPAMVSAAASPAPSSDALMIASVVRSVVARMAPPALSQELIQGLEAKLIEEILVERARKPASGA